MRDFDDAWLLPSGSHPDFNLNDWRREAEEAFQRQSAADRFFKGLRLGTVTVGEANAFFDQLAEQEIDPGQYLDAVEENMQTVMANGQPVNTYGLDQSRKIIT